MTHSQAASRLEEITRALPILLWILFISSTLTTTSAFAVDLTGQQVDLTYDFGNGSGSLSAIVGPGPEFFLEGAPAQGPGFSTATIDITADTLTLTHNRGTTLGPGLPTVSDDSLVFSFPDLPGGSIESTTLTTDPMPQWFGGLAFTGTSITLTQLLPQAGVNTQLKVWTIGFFDPTRVIKIGTWNVAPGFGNPTGVGGPGLVQGQRFVLKVGYDPSSSVVTRAVLTDFLDDSGQDLSAIDLDGFTNTLDLFVPMEGLGGGTPFIYTQTEADHFPEFTPLPSLHFLLGSDVSDGSNIIGVEYEGDFVPGANFNIIEIFNTAANPVSPIHQTSQVLNCFDSSCAVSAIAIRAVDGVVDAIPVAVDDTTLSYDAGGGSRTTSLAVQSNDLGAERSDGENFLTSAWTEAGAPLSGVTQANNVDIQVALVDAGLIDTTSTSTWRVELTEQLTELGDTAEVLVDYANSAPSSSLTATPTAAGYDFAYTFTDPDLAINSQIADFEQLFFTVRLDGAVTSVFDFLVSNAVQTLSNDALLAAFGSGTFSLDVTITDLAGDQFVSSDVFVVPEPSLATGLGMGVGLLALASRNRRARRRKASPVGRKPLRSAPESAVPFRGASE